jgi:D-glycero-D-manno-heptose 1,7-bisphosphate phosphatase
MALAAGELGFDPHEAVVIGDKPSDVEFGRNSGAMTLLVAADPSSEAARSARADHVVPDLREAAMIIGRLSEH